jgi:hypothetical protein
VEQVDLEHVMDYDDPHARWDNDQDLDEQIVAELAAADEYKARLYDEFRYPADLNREFFEALFAPDKGLIRAVARDVLAGSTDKAAQERWVTYLQDRAARGVRPHLLERLRERVFEHVERVRSLEVEGIRRFLPPKNGNNHEESLWANPYVFEPASALFDRPKPEDIIEGILVENSLAVLYGAYGSAKSFVALDWVLSIVFGCDWLDRKVKRGSVAYIAAEGQSGLASRIQAWCQQHKYTPDAPELRNLRVLGDAPDLINGQHAFNVMMAALDIPDLELIVIDTLHRSMIGDENSAQDMGKLIRNVEHLRQLTEAAVLMIHHTSKADATNIRGSSALPGAASTMLQLVRPGMGDNLTLSCSKQKESAEFEPIHLRFSVVELGGGKTSRIIEPGIDLFPKADGGILLRTLVDRFGAEGASYTAWMRASGMADSSFDRAKRSLEQGGYIEKADGRNGVYRPTAKAGELLSSTAPSSPVVDLSAPQPRTDAA